MSTIATPLNRQRSVKFTLDDSSAKPSIKITVSSDAISETILKNNVIIPSSNMDESNEDNNGQQQQQQPALIQIVGNCCNSNSEIGGKRVDNAPESGVLCSCANGGNEKRTRIALDDFTVLEFPNCIDFGIKDFLCCKDEIELDLSSDTDASFLDATPPHRFSDSELENQIEAMSITLDTQLNPFPNRSPFSMGNDEDEEEETTEESFIMDEEEASSSASNSAATICGDAGGNLADLEENEDDESHLHVNSSHDLLIQGEIPQEKQQESISDANEAEEAQSINKMGNNDDHDYGGDDGALPSCLKSISQEQLPEKREENNGYNETTAASQLSSDLNKLLESQGECKKVAINNGSRKMLKHPTKQFRRQISLPASIFMTYLLEQNNKANYCKPNNHLRQHQQHNNCEIIAKNKLNRSNSCKHRSAAKANGKGAAGIVIELQSPIAPLTPSKRIGSYRSSKVIHGSTEDYEEDDIHNSNSFSDTNEDYLVGEDERDAMLLSCESSKSKWNSAWDSKSDSFTTNPDDTNNDDMDDPHELDLDDEQQAFTSEVEKRSLILRHVRRLVRQDTTGNFAPPDFSI